jgi:RHS repeat-associated protein
VGNIVYSRDDARQAHYFKNTVVKAESQFEYDAVYQLLKATGRELAGLGGNTQRDNQDLPCHSQLPHVNDTNAVRQYTQRYAYDDCGNIKQMRHIATAANWTRHYRYEYQDDANNKTNRLKSTSLPGDADSGPYSATYQHDLHGNMTKMPHLDELVWNFMDQLTEVNLGGGGKAYYVYGLGGSRIRKVIERIGGKKIERFYLGAVEIYREYQGNDKKLERSTLHISDNTGRIAQVDTKLLDENNTDPANPLNKNLIRYQYTNHLGSATMETDEKGVVISYEEYHPYGTSAYRSSKSDVDLSLKRYRFSGKERDDETGLYYFGARYYAAWLGRWASSDPAGFVDGLNLYKYCDNNSIVVQDYNGTKGYRTIHEKDIGIGIGFWKPKHIREAQLNPGIQSGRKYEKYIRSREFKIKGKTYIAVGGELTWLIRDKGPSYWVIHEAKIVEVPQYETRVVASQKEAPASGSAESGSMAPQASGGKPQREVVDDSGNKIDPTQGKPRSEAPAKNTAIRKSDVDPKPTREGFKAANPKGKTTAAQHALGEGLHDSPYISLSENPKGAPDIKGEKSWIDIDRTRESGTEYLSNEQVKEQVRQRAVNDPGFKVRAEKWEYAQTHNKKGIPELGGEEESLVKGDIPGRAVETKGMRAAKGFGRALMFFGIAVTSYELTRATSESIRIWSPAPIVAESIRQSSAWGLAILVVSLIAPISVPAILLGIGLGFLGGVVGYAIGDCFADPIYEN